MGPYGPWEIPGAIGGGWSDKLRVKALLVARHRASLGVEAVDDTSDDVRSGNAGCVG